MFPFGIILLAGGVSAVGVGIARRQSAAQSAISWLTPPTSVEKNSIRAVLQEEARTLYDRTRSLLNIREETAADSLSTDKRHALLLAAEDENALTESGVDHHLLLSGVTLGATALSAFFFPPLQLLAVPVIVYLELPLLYSAWDEIVRERQFKLNGLLALFVTGTLLARAFVTSAFGIFVLALSNRLTAQTRDRSQKKLVQMFDAQPRQVTLFVDDREMDVPFAALQAQDILVVHAGQMLPADGVVVNGSATVDQHRLTGESRPVERGAGDEVFAATLVVRGWLHVRVERAGRDTLAAQIGQILEQTTAYHLQAEERGLSLAERAVPPTMLLSGVALLTLGFPSAVATLTVSPGIDMLFAAPLALLTFLHLSSDRGILVKDGRSLELLHNVDTVIFDKTGTLTLEEPEVVEIHLCGEVSAEQVLLYAAAAESRQSHPIAQAIRRAAEKRHLALPDGENLRFEAGFGVQIQLDGRLVRVGSQRFMQNEGVEIAASLASIQQQCAAIGHSLVYVAMDGAVAGALELRPTIRPEAPAIIADLKARGLQLYILSGDQEEPTRHLAEQLGIESYFANVLPEAKSGFVEQLQAEGRTICFVGDGINDAIALKKAQVSVSLRGATTVATDSAQIVLMGGTLEQLPALFDLAHRLERNLLTSFGLSLGTGGVILGAVFGLHMGIGAAVAIGSLGMMTTVANSIMPLLLTMRQEDDLSG